MVRKVKDKYNFWLVGYYDDFNGARALPNDDNSPSATSGYTHNNTHFGNPLNGEATLNPRYRWSYHDRVDADTLFPQSKKFSLATNDLLHNKGVFEWLSHDSNRNYSDEAQGRVQIQYPDGHTNTNKYKLYPQSGGGTDAYQMFCNGHNTLAKYVIPTGDIDSSFGRKDMLNFSNTYTSKTGGKNTWVEETAMGGSSVGDDDSLTIVRRAHLAGKWMGETLKYGSANETRPLNVFAPLESPSGMPFLCVQQFNKISIDGTPSEPTIYYDGSLNSRDTNDVLHFRLAVRSFNGGTTNNGKITPRVTIKAGFSSSPSSTNMKSGLTGSAAISFNLDLTNYDTNPLLYAGNSTKITYTNDDSWIDVDVVLDYDNNTYKVYQDGILKSTTTGFTATAEDLYGWEIYMHPFGGSSNVTSTLMLDRAALCRPLTDDPSERDLPPVDNMKINTTINGYSNFSLDIVDDPEDNIYQHQFTNVFIGNKLADWGIVCFAASGETGDKSIPRIDRPIWRGVLKDIKISEKNSGVRKISISGTDTLNLLDKSIPMWESGQNARNENETVTPYWAYDAEGLIEVLDLGQTTLKQFAATVGRDFSNSYENRAEQRTQLTTSHPIQMYNNEDANAPNDLEDDFEGIGVDYFYEDQTGIRLVLSGNPQVPASGNIVLDNTGVAGYDGLTVAVTARHSIDATGAIVTYNSSHDVQVLTVAKGSGSGQLPLVDENANNIAYIGKYLGLSLDHDDPNYSFDSFDDRNATYLQMLEMNPATWVNGRGGIAGLNILNSGSGYTISNGYYTDVDIGDGNTLRLPKGNINLPPPVQPDPSAYPHWSGTSATAEWESVSGVISGDTTVPDADDLTNTTWTDGEIVNTVVTNSGSGYSTGSAYYTDITGSTTSTGYTANATTLNLTNVKGFSTLSTNYGTITDGNTSHAFTWTGKVDDSNPRLTGVVGIASNYSSGATVKEDRILGTGTFDNNGATLTFNSTSAGSEWPEDGSSTMPSGTTFNLQWGVNGSNHADYEGAYWATSDGDWDTSGTGLNINITVEHDSNGNAGTISHVVTSGGSGFKTGDTVVAVVNYDQSDGDGDYISIEFDVTCDAIDVELEIIQTEQAHSDTFTFFMDTSTTGAESLSAGDHIVISNNQSVYANIVGRHQIKSIKKVLNYHNNSVGTPQRRFLWQVQTFTTIPQGFVEGAFGDFNREHGLLSSTYWGDTINARVGWSKMRGATITPKTSENAEDITSRAIHARWMRDLPMSLWFRYHFAKIKYNSKHTFDLVSAITANATTVEITQATFNAIDNHGVCEIVKPNYSINYETRKDTRDFFIYRFKYVDNSSGSNKWYLGGCKYISESHPTTVNAWHNTGTYGSQNVKVHIVDNDTNYKHIWLLWADMRNDGTANADGGQRDKVFGMKYPTSDNYSVELQFDDQQDVNGNPESFAELKIGEDLEIWEVDATNDDSTGGAFSKPLDYANAVGLQGNNISSVSGKLSIQFNGHGFATGDYVGLLGFGDYDGTYTVTATDSNNFVVDVAYTGGIGGTITKYFYAKTTGSDKDKAQYQDWEDKGGSFLVLDASLFFNLNTTSNKGRVGQEGGGKTDLGSYFATGVGDPVLVDSYYRNASSNSSTTGANYRSHSHLEDYIASKTELSSSIIQGQFWFEPSDITIFRENGVGRLLGLKNESDTRSEWLYTWDGKIDSDYSLSSVTVTEYNNYWKITKSGGQFITKGVNVGTYIKNTSKPLVKGVGASWRNGTYELEDIAYYYRVKKVVSETEIHVERVGYWKDHLPSIPQTFPSLQYYINQQYSIYNGGLFVEPHTTAISNDGWATGHNLTIPKQLYNVMLDTANSASIDNNRTSTSVREAFTRRLHQLVSTSSIGGVINGSKPHAIKNVDKSLFSVVEVYNSPANEYAYRLMMKLTGKYKNLNSGTFYDSDKFKVLWSNALLRSWMPPTKLTNMFDIQNVPLTQNMTTYNDNTSFDSYGSTFNSNGKTLMSTVTNVKDISGNGDTNGLFTSFSWLVGRDNRIDFRPKYNSGYSITRDQVKASSIKMNQLERVENVRVVYDSGKGFVDYPKPNLTDTTSWKVISSPDIRSSLEALVVARKEYNSRKKNPLALDIEMLRLFNSDKDAMLDGGRYGYIADAQVALQGNNDQSLGTAWCWTIMGTGGVPFSGMVNALDGNMGGTVTSSTFNKRVGSSGEVSGTSVSFDNNYKWYGSRSVSKAVQIVHVGKGVPKVNSAGERLRIFIAIKPNQAAETTIENAEFRVFLADTTFTTSTASGYAVDLTGTITSHSYKDVKYNGMYEIDVPSGYGTGKIVFSFNADYCRDLLRSRCGSVTDTITTSGVVRLKVLHNSTAALGNSVGGSFPIVLDGGNNVDSIFPLGCRQYSNMRGGIGSTRELWYAPSVNIVDDLNYIPATYIKYTDSAYDINNKTMVIANVNWSVKQANGESVKLFLQEDESTSSGGILSYVTAPTKAPAPTKEIIGGTVVDTGSITDEIDKGLISGGFFPFQPDRGFKFDSQVKINHIGTAAYKILKAQKNSSGSQFASQYGNNILGQEVMGQTPSTMRRASSSIPIIPTQGSAITDNNGVKFGGKGREDGLGAAIGDTPSYRKLEIQHSAEAKIQVPADALTDEINLTADISLPVTTNQASATLFVRVQCLETNAYITESLNIPTGSNFKNMQLCSTAILEGAGITGNTILVTLTRRPAYGNDTANYTSLAVNNLDVNFRRAAFNAQNSNNVFLPN